MHNYSYLYILTLYYLQKINESNIDIEGIKTVFNLIFFHEKILSIYKINKKNWNNTQSNIFMNKKVNIQLNILISKKSNQVNIQPNISISKKTSKQHLFKQICT